MMKRNIRLLIAPSKKLGESLRANGFKRINVLPYFIDLKFWKKVNKNKIFKKKEKILLYVGGLTRHKGVHILIDAISKLPQEIQKTITLKIVGKGNYEEELKKQIREKEILAKIIFLGFKNSPELRKLYLESFAFIMPSIWAEQFGIVGLEAMACSTPAIASNIGGIPEWLTDGNTGLLFTPGNSEDLKEKLIYLLNNPLTAKKYGENARKNVENNFSKEEHIKKLINIYKSLR